MIDREAVARDLQRLRGLSDAIDALVRNRTRTTARYTDYDYVFDAIGREICSIIDEYARARSSQTPGIGSYEATPQWIAVYAHLSLDLLDVVCLHLQLWLSTTDPARHMANMFKGGRLVDVDTMPMPSDRLNAARSQISRSYPRIIEAYSYVGGAAGLSGAPELPPENPELRCVRLFEAFCSITDVAIALLRAKLEAYQIVLKLGVVGDSRANQSVFDDDDDDDDRPKSAAEFAALTRRQSGESPFDDQRSPRFRRWIRGHSGEELPRAGLHVSIERGIWGATGGDFLRAIAADDPTVCMIKRRAKIQSFFRPTPQRISYQYAFPASAVRRLYNGVALANRQGLVLNVRLGVSWFNVPGCTAADCGAYFAQFKKNLVQWFADRGLTAPYPALLFVHECKGSDRFHTHMMVAVPEVQRDAFTKHVRKALERVLKLRDLPKRVLWVRWRKIADYALDRRWPITRDQWTGLTYLLKGADPGVELGLNISGSTVAVGDITEWGYEDPGQPFAGPPWGTSEALGPGSQKAFRDSAGAPFHSLLDWQIDKSALDWRDLYTDYYLDQAAGRRGPEPPVFEPARPRPPAPPSTELVWPDFPALLRDLKI
jgi:hypothetical protein